jgi:YtkA-like
MKHRLWTPGGDCCAARIALIGALSGAAALGCSSKSQSDGEPDGGDTAAQPDSGTVGCSAEGQTYTADMVQAGMNGKYTFTLVSANPAPPGLDTNVWTMKIVDATGAPPPVDQVVAYPFMPKMGHGSSQVPQFAANADGSFSVSDVYLFMDGLWTVTFSVMGPEVDGGAKPLALDSAVYTFCIND